MKLGPFFFMLLRLFVQMITKVVEAGDDDEDKKDLQKNGFGTTHD